MRRASANCSSASARAVKPGKHNGLRDLLGSSVAGAGARSGCRRALFGADQCRAAAGRGARPRHQGDPRRRRDGARAGACADVPPPRCRPRSAPRSMSRPPAAGKNIAVLMAYADRLERFSRWYVQLWAESLGKDGKGTTPLGALGPVDQHSQLQLFIAGPRDKLFTVITVGTRGARARASTRSWRSARASRISPARPSAISSPRRAAPPPRRSRRTAARCAPCTSRQLDETSLGALMMHFMLETIIAAHLHRRRRVRPAGGGRRQGAGEAVSGGKGSARVVSPAWPRSSQRRRSRRDGRVTLRP